jgi:hypothetical protein
MINREEYSMRRTRGFANDRDGMNEMNISEFAEFDEFDDD